MRIKEVLSNGISILKQFNIEDGTLKAKILLADLLDKSKEYLIIHSDDEIDEKINKIFIERIERLKNKVGYTDIVFNMMPELFTLSELQQVYEVILGKKLLDPAFRRIISDKVEKTDMMRTGGGHRPSALFRYKKNTK